MNTQMNLIEPDIEVEFTFNKKKKPKRNKFLCRCTLALQKSQNKKSRVKKHQ